MSRMQVTGTPGKTLLATQVEKPTPKVPKIPGKFSVKLFDFVARLKPNSLLDLNGSTVLQGEYFLKLDFDRFKLFQTDRETSSSDIEWSFKAGFIYTTKCVQKLSSQRMKVYLLDSEESKQIATASVDLRTLACGPNCVILELLLDKSSSAESAGIKEQKNVIGHIAFNCVMRMSSPNFSLILKNMRITMQGSSAPGKLSIGTNLKDNISAETPFSETGVWKTDKAELSFETSLHDLLLTKSSEEDFYHPALIVRVLDEFAGLQGDVRVKFAECLQGGVINADITYGAESSDRVGEFHGELFFQNLPRYAQMVSGCVNVMCQKIGILMQQSGGKSMSKLALDGYLRSQEDDHSTENLAGLLLSPALEFPNFIKLNVSRTEKQIIVLRLPTEQMLKSIQQISRSLLVEEGPILTPDEVALPKFWELRKSKDPKHGSLTYFADCRSQKTTWQDPRFLPKGWEQRVCRESGSVYFAYGYTKQTTFVDPRALPEGWEMRLSNLGVEYFIHKKQTSWHDPRGLEHNWECCLDDRGRVYYKNHKTLNTSWTDPRKGYGREMVGKLRRLEYRTWWGEKIRKWREG